MTDQPKDKSNPVNQPDKKKSETVQLTAEDLRAISGGTTAPPSRTQPKTNDAIGTPKKQ
jgi:hypothetical protein